MKEAAQQSVVSTVSLLIMVLTQTSSFHLNYFHVVLHECWHVSLCTSSRRVSIKIVGLGQNNERPLNPFPGQ